MEITKMNLFEPQFLHLQISYDNNDKKNAYLSKIQKRIAQGTFHCILQKKLVEKREC